MSCDKGFLLHKGSFMAQERINKAERRMGPKKTRGFSQCFTRVSR